MKQRQLEKEPATNEQTPIWDPTRPHTITYSALGCALALPSAWRIVRRAEGVCAAPADYEATSMPPPYEFRVNDAATGITQAMTRAVGIADLEFERLPGPRLATIARASYDALDAPMSVCIIGEYFDHRRRCALHIVRERAHTTIPPSSHALRIWRNAPIDDRGEAQHWVSEAAGLHLTVPRTWMIDVHEPQRIVTRQPCRSRSRPSLVVAVAAGSHRPRTLRDMIECCGRSTAPWMPMRLGNRAALRRTVACTEPHAASDEFVHQIITEPGAEAAAFVEFVTPRIDDQIFAAATASRAWPGFQWLRTS